MFGSSFCKQTTQRLHLSHASSDAPGHQDTKAPTTQPNACRIRASLYLPNAKLTWRGA